jgi:hypothetical protein
MNTHIKDTIESVDTIIENNNNPLNFNLETEELYQKLMNKEDKVLNLLDEIHTQKTEAKTNFESFVSAPLHVIIFNTFNTLTKVIIELSETSSINDGVAVILQKDNATYVGILFVFFAIILMFVTL